MQNLKAEEILKVNGGMMRVEMNPLIVYFFIALTGIGFIHTIASCISMVSSILHKIPLKVPNTDIEKSDTELSKGDAELSDRFTSHLTDSSGYEEV
jgi:hypothetical protein